MQFLENECMAPLKFRRDDRLGFLTLDPKDLGTALRIRARIELAELTEIVLDEILANHGLDKRRLGKNNRYEVFNRRCFGLTERDILKATFDGLAKVVKMERDLQKK